jgi:surface antigen
MRGPSALFAAATALALASPAFADSADFDPPSTRELAPYLQCVPYARERSGVQIYGDAWTWWDQAAGRYKRGNTPRPGAVMAFRPYGGMRLGHVAAVARVIDSRTVLLDHANWSPIDGRRGQIERGVMAVDVSAANDWSAVRVWYDPVQKLGTTAWPVAGFIYNERDDGARTVLARADYAAAAAGPAMPATPSRRFMQAFTQLAEPAAPQRVEPRRPKVRGVPIAQSGVDREPVAEQPAKAQPAPVRPTVREPAPKPSDPIGAALAMYDRR